LDQAFVTESIAGAVTTIRYDWGGPEPPSDHAAIPMEVAV